MKHLGNKSLINYDYTFSEKFTPLTSFGQLFFNIVTDKKKRLLLQVNAVQKTHETLRE